MFPRDMPDITAMTIILHRTELEGKKPVSQISQRERYWFGLRNCLEFRGVLRRIRVGFNRREVYAWHLLRLRN